MKVLVLLAHPAFERSQVNRRLAEAARQVPGVTVHDLYEAYPDLHLDVAREQELLLGHDVVIFQHPFFWYSTPSLLKEWQDLVLEHGWAYGTGGAALAGKVTFNAISAGGPETSYRKDGYNRFTIRELLSPYEATANLCRMRYLAPFVVHGVLRAANADKLVDHARDYRRLLEALVAGRVDLDAAARAERLNADLDAVLRREDAGPRGAATDHPAGG